MNYFFRAFTIIFTMALTASCENEETNLPIGPASSEEIIVVNSPLHYFATELAGDLAAARFPVPPGTDPSEWTPNTNDVIRMQQAELVLLNGAGYSSWLDKVSLTDSKVINTGKSFSADLIPIEQQTTHSHGPGTVHAHGGYAFTTWMDMEFAKEQVRSIALAMVKVWPSALSDISDREGILLERLTSLEEAYREQAAHLSGRTIIYSHPVYQYFDRRYQLKGRSVHWEPGVPPTEQQWRELEKLVNDKGDALLIWEDFPDDSVLERLKIMNIQSVVVRPAADRKEDDWYREQEENIKRLDACCSVPRKPA